MMKNTLTFYLIVYYHYANIERNTVVAIISSFVNKVYITISVN